MKIICSQRVFRFANRAEIHIPFGLTHFYKTALLRPDTSLTLDSNKVVCIEANNTKIQVYPYYCKAINIPNLPHLTFSVVVSEKDKKACTTLISQTHYLSAPSKGIYFAIKSRDEIIACCIIDTLEFGNPKGRYHIDPSLYESLGMNDKKWGIPSPEIRLLLQERLKLIWISRIARAHQYRGLQLGTHVVQETLKALPSILPFAVKHVEVIRRCEINDASSTDFLEHAGFAKVKLKNQRAPFYSSNGDLFPKPKPYVKLYYWRKIEQTSCFENARLFVPLSQDPFTWFAENKKTWELRRMRGQYTERQIYQGRPIELRLGYNTNCKLWGIINKVITGASIESVLTKIGSFESVIPTASSLKDAADKAHNILKSPSDSYIAFEVTAIFNPDNITCLV